jgi:hypothetical protein
VGKILFPGIGLTEDEIPDLREEIKRLQVESAEFASQNFSPGSEGAAVVDEDQPSAEDLAAAALNCDFVIGQVFIAHLDVQLGGDSFQMLKQQCITQIECHRCARAPSRKALLIFLLPLSIKGDIYRPRPMVMSGRIIKE